MTTKSTLEGLPAELKEKIFGYICHEDNWTTKWAIDALGLETDALLRQVREQTIDLDKILLDALVTEGKRLAEIDRRCRRGVEYYKMFKRVPGIVIKWYPNGTYVTVEIPSGAFDKKTDHKRRKSRSNDEEETEVYNNGCTSDLEIAWRNGFSCSGGRYCHGKSVNCYRWEHFETFQVVFDLWVKEKGLVKEDLLVQETVEFIL